MRRLLQLHHHKHTGKLLHHKHTSYPALILVLLAAFVVAVALERTARATDYTVIAKVSATIPTAPASITSPSAGSVFDLQSIDISGNCQAISPSIFVVIYANNHLLGSTICSAGSFSFTALLPFAGELTLVARSVNFTEDYGPDSDPITISYEPPIPSPLITSQPQHPSTPAHSTEIPVAPQNASLTLNTKQEFLLINRERRATWEGFVSGGKPPYTTTFDWGDGREEVIRSNESEHLTVSHTYDHDTVRVVTVSSVDSSGNRVTQRLVAISAGQLATRANTPNPATIDHTYLLGVYTIGTLAIMAGIWLFESQLGLLHAIRHTRRT